MKLFQDLWVIPPHCSWCAFQVVDAIAIRFHRVTGSHKYVTSTCSPCCACGGLIQLQESARSLGLGCSAAVNQVLENKPSESLELLLLMIKSKTRCACTGKCFTLPQSTKRSCKKRLEIFTLHLFVKNRLIQGMQILIKNICFASRLQSNKKAVYFCHMYSCLITCIWQFWAAMPLEKDSLQINTFSKVRVIRKGKKHSSRCRFLKVVSMLNFEF